MSEPPAALAALLDRACERLASDPAGHLRLGLRQQIWAALGPREVTGRGFAVPGVGHRRRVALAAACARRVLPVWDRAFPHDPLPRHILDHVDGFAAGDRGMLVSLTADRREFRRVESLIRDHRSRPALVLYAALQAGTCALYDEQFDPGRLHEWASDLADRDFYDWDAAFLASCVEAGGTLDSGSARAEDRRAFWGWYLTEAAPASYDVAATFDG